MIPSQENDISWQTLRRIIQEWSGTSAELDQVKPLAGGHINTTLALHTKDNQRFVIKISAHRVNRDHEREAYQLNLLRDRGLPVPSVYAWKMGSLEEPFSYLLMEFVDGIDLGAAKKTCTPEQFDQIQIHLAELVRAMHDQTADRYMRVMEGGGQQFDAWPAFYHAIYDTIWKETEKSVPGKLRKQIWKVHEKLDRLIVHGDKPRLVHWDIWATNVLVAPDPAGRWRVTALLDPNCKYAHAEAEIAYLELFHTITPAFLKAYQNSHRLDDQYHRVRKWVYQLYPLINHVHLFGSEYLKPLGGAVERVRV